MQLVLDVQLIWARVRVAAGTGTDRHDVPFQAMEAEIPAPAVRQYLGPEHQTEFGAPSLAMPGWLAGAAVAGARSL